MLYHHIETVFVVHDCAQTHNAHVNVIGRCAHIQFGYVTRSSLQIRTIDHFVETWPKETVWFRVATVTAAATAFTASAISRRCNCWIFYARLLFGGFFSALLNALLMPHHSQTKMQVIDERVESLVFFVQEFFHPFDVICSQWNLQVAQHLRGRRFANNFSLLKFDRT